MGICKNRSMHKNFNNKSNIGPIVIKFALFTGYSKNFKSFQALPNRPENCIRINN